MCLWMLSDDGKQQEKENSSCICWCSYWNFLNVKCYAWREQAFTVPTYELKSVAASAPGIWLLAQLSSAKVVATALCKGSGIVGGLYAPSLMIVTAVGAIFGGLAGELFNQLFQEMQLLRSHKHMHWLTCIILIFVQYIRGLYLDIFTYNK